MCRQVLGTAGHCPVFLQPYAQHHEASDVHIITLFLEVYAPPFTPSVKIGYEISFARHFFKPQPMRPLEKIRVDILELEQESEGLLAEIVGR